MLFHIYLADMFPHTGGFLIGMAFGIGTRYVLRFMRHLGAGIEQQVALTFALGYLSFYTANGPAGVSGPAQGYISWPHWLLHCPNLFSESTLSLLCLCVFKM